jgi:heme A synthase
MVITRPSAGFRRLAVATAVLTYLLIVWGGIVRVTGSGNGCGTSDQWPLCHGSLLPAWQINTLIEFTHRWIASVCTLLVIILTVATWVWHRHHRRILIGVSVAAGLFIVQIALGALAVEYNLPGGVVMIHLANALLLFAVLIYVAVVATTAGTTRGSAAADKERGGVASVKWPVIVAVAATYLVAMSGAFVVETNSGGGCNSWPLCGSGFSLPAGETATINVAHRLVALIVVLLLGGLMAMILRKRRGDRRVRIGVMAVNLMLVLQVAAGALVVELGLPAWVRGLHIALASLLWGSVVAVAAYSTQDAREAATVAELHRTDGMRSHVKAAST